ncbi:MAG: DUF4019 domain-containing protein [Betaproteobacteria bacterium]|nr:DUF4019 domain-containing protein [Betaproteobacteria bacterium]
MIGTRIWQRALLIALVVFATAAAALANSGGDPRVAEAKDRALAWLALTDAGKGVESWRLAANAFRIQATNEKWSDVLRSVRAPLGETKSRRPRMAQYTTQLAGAPDGEYVVLGFFSSFENKLEAEETVILTREAGSWKPLGYFIK